MNQRITDAIKRAGTAHANVTAAMQRIFEWLLKAIFV
jgi:hypothetical protein